MIKLCIGKCGSDYLEKLLNKELSKQNYSKDNIIAQTILDQILSKKSSQNAKIILILPN